MEEFFSSRPQIVESSAIPLGHAQAKLSLQRSDQEDREHDGFLEASWRFEHCQRMFKRDPLGNLIQGRFDTWVCKSKRRLHVSENAQFLGVAKPVSQRVSVRVSKRVSLEAFTAVRI